MSDQFRLHRTVSAAALMTASMFVGDIAIAQDLTQYQGVLQRPRSEFEAQGIRAGAFQVFPSIDLGAEYNDNIFATDEDEESDIIFVASPELRVNSTWSRHAVGLTARGRVRQYSDFDDESSNDYGITGNGRIDVRRDTQINISGRFSQDTEARSATTAPDGTQALDRPEFKSYGGQIEIAHVFNRLRARAGVRYEEVDFEDVRANPDVTVNPNFDPANPFIDQDFRDRQVAAVRGRLEYIISPMSSIYLSAEYNERNFNGVQRFGIDPITNLEIVDDRDSQGYNVRLGAVFEVSNLVQGELFAGYQSRSFDDDDFTDSDGIDVGAEIQWFATQLTTVTIEAGSGIEDATIRGASSFFNYYIQARADHELRRNLLLNIGGAYSNDNFDGINREDSRFSGVLGASYFLNRRVGVGAQYAYTDRDSTVDDLNFTSNSITLTLRGQL